jgi:hypothetical protein
MSAWSYYSPFWLGTLIAALVMALGWNSLWELPGWQVTLILGGVSLAFGVLCQIEMFAVQGAFGQVLPVPGGRTIRGRAAVFAGVFLFCAVKGALICAFFVSEGVRGQAMLAGVTAGGLLLAFLGLYAWSLPAAVRDFADDRGV